MRTNFQMENENITMIRGDTLAFNVAVTDEDGNVVNVDYADFTCKKLSADHKSVFHKSLGDGIRQLDGLLTVRVAPEDTQEVDAGRYFYDLCIGVGHDKYTVMNGVLNVEQDVTF